MQYRPYYFCDYNKNNNYHHTDTHWGRTMLFSVTWVRWNYLLVTHNKLMIQNWHCNFPRNPVIFVQYYKIAFFNFYVKVYIASIAFISNYENLVHVIPLTTIIHFWKPVVSFEFLGSSWTLSTLSCRWVLYKKRHMSLTTSFKRCSPLAIFHVNYLLIL